LQGDDWVAGRGQFGHKAVVAVIAGQFKVDEQPISAIGFHGRGRLADHGQDTLALFAQAFGNQLLGPIAEAGQGGRG